MLLPLSVVLVAIGLGLATGGRLRKFEQVQLHWWVLAPLGLAMQLSPLPAGDGRAETVIATAVLVSSFPILLLFAGRNVRLPGFPLLFLGLALNFIVIAPNGGMPVSARAITVASESVEYRDLQKDGDAKHHLLTDKDVLPYLSDIIAVGSPIGAVLSIGDVLVYCGLAWFIFATMRAPTPRTARSTRRYRGYRGKHRMYRRTPRGRPMFLRAVAEAKSGNAP
jgi:Family of unknown function (DUF5317)